MAGWSKPSSANVFKINCKGVFDEVLRKAAVACIMRNNRGHWVRGNAGMMGMMLPLAAELWSIFYGLKMAWEKGDVKSVFIESDSEEAVNEVNNPDPHFWLADLVVLITNLQNEAWDSCVVVHVATSSNEAATAFANSQLSGDGGLVEFDQAPPFLYSNLAADRM